MATTNKKRFLAFHQDILLAKNLDRLVEHVCPDVISHNPLPNQQPGAAGLRAALEVFFAAFPDMQSSATVLLEDGDLVACRFTTAGTHKGSFMGYAPTGEAFTYEEMVFVRYRDGKICEHWAVADVLDMMTKMGAITFKEPA